MFGFASAAGSTAFLNRRAHALHKCGRHQPWRQPQQCDTCAKPIIACTPPVSAGASSSDLPIPTAEQIEDLPQAAAPESDIEDIAALEADIEQSLSTSDDFDLAPVQDYVNIVRTNAEQSLPVDDQGPLDLMQLDSAGRKALDDGSYESIVDVNITAGGLLNIVDGDNNELFSGVGLDALLDHEQLLKNLRKEFSITTATHVQLAAIPRIQAGEDLVVQGHTGTGKTLAFLLPLLESIDTTFPNVQVVVIAPTRELAMQISGECSRLCAGTEILSMPLIGGANPARQVEKLKRRMPHILIGTPGRLAELEEARVLSLRRLHTLVIDEVDQCMREPFRASVDRLLTHCSKSRQLVLVSATGDVGSVREFAKSHMRKAHLLRVGDTHCVPKNISNWFVVVPHRMRIDTLRKLMFAEPAPERAICFVDDPRRADLVVERLYKMKIPAAALRGNAHKLERAEVVKAFRIGRVKLLITTEIAARGLDVPEVTHVFNLDLPTDADHYVHRAGRCGRVGADGVVVSIATPETAFVMKRLQKQLDLEITQMEPRDGRFSKPLPRKERIDRPVAEKSTPVKEKLAPKQKGDAQVEVETKIRKPVSGKRAVAATPKAAQSEGQKVKKPGKKKRGKQGTSLPKGTSSTRSISAHAKSNGWVGNRR